MTSYGQMMQQAQLMERVARDHARQTEFVELRVLESACKVIPRIRKLDRKTIGQISHDYEMPEDAKDLIDLAREVRNEVAHEFFDSIDPHSEDGRIKALGRLLGASQIFGAASHARSIKRTSPGRERA